MWSWWTPIQSRPTLPTFPISPSPAIFASARPTHSSNHDDRVKVGGVGLAVLAAYKSKPVKANHTNPIQQEKQDSATEGGQLNGSDVLLALQQAATKKNKSSGGGKKNKIKKGSSTTRSGESDDDDEQNENDFHNSVRPLMIKSQWGKRIEDLERRLQELSGI